MHMGQYISGLALWRQVVNGGGTSNFPPKKPLALGIRG